MQSIKTQQDTRLTGDKEITRRHVHNIYNNITLKKYHCGKNTYNVYNTSACI